MEDDIDIVSNSTEQGDEEAFAAGFESANVGQEKAPKLEATPEPEVAPEPEVEVEAEPEVAPEPEVEKATAKLFAGLTEEQLQAALAKSGSLQTTVDKLSGRMGALMQQLDAIKSTPPTTHAAQVALDLKLEKLGAAFPHLAELLREDLQAIQSSGVPTPSEPPAPQGITQEQLDALFTERLNATQETMRTEIEQKVLTVMHPTWLEDINSDSFALYKNNVLSPADSKALMESEDAAFISRGLTAYKNWLAATTAPEPEAPPAPKVPSRLANALIPKKGGERVSNGPISEEDAFNAGFVKEQKRHGYA